MVGSILVVDDDRDMASMLRDTLERSGWSTTVEHSAESALERLHSNPADVVVADVLMKTGSGIELCAAISHAKLDTLPIMITGGANLDMAIAALRAGAFDFLTKPLNLDVLAVTVRRAMEQIELTREVKRLRTAELKAFGMADITGTSPAIQETMEMIRRVADSDASVLITGESGTGKELVARALHNQSSKLSQPFIAVNCAAMPSGLLESELFGHVRGAFTDAHSTRSGLFLQAGSGTLFLDEIGDMPLDLQVKLLRVLQQRTVRPVGGDEEIPFRARIVTATNKDLEVEVANKRFREDLFYRINVIGITVPPLRERPGDILVLAHQFVHRMAARSGKAVKGISEHAARFLVKYDWPGNVRELENCIDRAVALARFEEITVEDLPIKVLGYRASKIVIACEPPSELITIEEMQRRYVRLVVAAVGGHRSRAAELLGIDRRTVYRYLKLAPEPGEAVAAIER